MRAKLVNEELGPKKYKKGDKVKYEVWAPASGMKWDSSPEKISYKEGRILKARKHWAGRWEYLMDDGLTIPESEIIEKIN
jgi:hypothetical protein